MNPKNLLVRTIVTFAALSIAGISVAVSARYLTDALEQTIMIAAGCAIFGAALTFFLVRFFALSEKL